MKAALWFEAQQHQGRAAQLHLIVQPGKPEMAQRSIEPGVARQGAADVGVVVPVVRLLLRQRIRRAGFSGGAGAGLLGLLHRHPLRPAARHPALSNAVPSRAFPAGRSGGAVLHGPDAAALRTTKPPSFFRIPNPTPLLTPAPRIENRRCFLYEPKGKNKTDLPPT